MTWWLLALLAQEGWTGEQPDAPDTEDEAEEEPEPDSAPAPEPEPDPQPESEPDPPSQPDPETPGFDLDRAIDVEEREATAPDLPDEVLREAQEAPPLSNEQLEWLRPEVHKLPNNPYAHTDFTAYTLDWGEMKIGLSNIQIAILPRTQIGTNLPLDLLGIYNANAKVDMIRLGPWDLAISGSRYMFRQPDFTLNYTGAGVVNSLQLTKKWSVHFGASYFALGIEGLPDPEAIHPLLRVSEDDLRQILDPLDYVGETVTARIATDIRLNRRDSFILQGSALVWNDTDGDVTDVVLPLLGFDQVLQGNGWRSPADIYSVSLAYQADFKRLSMRFGVGYSTAPWAWTLQSFELSYRFGGKVKRDERVQRRTWRQNRKDVTN